jgi:hypothetical protein
MPCQMTQKMLNDIFLMKEIKVVSIMELNLNFSTLLFYFFFLELMAFYSSLSLSAIENTVSVICYLFRFPVNLVTLYCLVVDPAFC